MVAQDGGAPQTRLAFTVAGSRSVVVNQPTLLAARIRVSEPAQLTAVLRNAKQQRLHTWRLRANAGATIVKLRLPARLARPATYRLTWIARSDSEVVSRTSTVTLVNPAKATPKRTTVAVLMTGHALRWDAPPRPSASARSRTPTMRSTRSRPEGFDVVVADADLFGTAFVADLRRRLRDVYVIAVSREPARRTQSRKAGAVLALPRFVTSAQLAKAIARIAAS